jgi:hypothetical protein
MSGKNHCKTPKAFVSPVESARRSNLAVPVLLAWALFFSSCGKQTLSDEAKRDLEPFFRTLFTKSEFAYTLFGDKPMSFYTYFYKQPRECFTQATLFEPRLEQHYKTYKKYKHLFNTQHFLLLDQPCISDKFPTSGYVRDILIINKCAFIETVDKHRDIFTQRLAMPITGKALLTEIESNKNALYEVLHEDELLWGILLGYGLHNAELYARREEINDHKAVMPSIGFTSLEEELNSIDNILTGFTHEYHIDLIPQPLFFCNKSDAETLQLKEKYRQIQEKICETYSSKDFLALVFRQFYG